MRRLLCLLPALPLLAACSMLDSLNPFAGSARVKPTALAPIQADAELRSLWQADVGSSGDFTLVPAVQGTTIYAAASDGTVARFEAGREAWRVKAGQTLSGGVGADAKMVVVGTPKGDVLAFDANGKTLWQSRVSSEVLAPPMVVENQVLVRSGDNRIYALDVLDGKRRWVFQRSTPPLSLRAAVGVVVTDGKVLAGFPGGKLVAISLSNGAALWEATVALPRGATELERVADVSSAPVVSGRAVCAVAFQGRVACFDLTNGNSLWSREMSSDVGLAADDRGIYVTDDKGVVHAFDRANGASMWKQDKLAMRGVSRPLTLARHVLVGDAAGVLHLLKREDGSFAARFTADSSGIVAPPQPFDGGALIQTRKGGLFALAVR